MSDKAALEFRGYRVNSLQFRAKPGFVPKQAEIELQPTLRKTLNELGPDEYEIELNIELNQEDLPFDATVCVTGSFRHTGDPNLGKRLQLNAVAILYPYLRATLSLLTALAEMPPLRLPTVNVAQMLADAEQAPLE